MAFKNNKTYIIHMVLFTAVFALLLIFSAHNNVYSNEETGSSDTDIKIEQWTFVSDNPSHNVSVGISVTDNIEMVQYINTDSYDWINNGSYVDFPKGYYISEPARALTYMEFNWNYTFYKRFKDNNVDTLQIVYNSEDNNFILTSQWIFYEHIGVLSHNLTIENRSDQSISLDSMSSLSLNISTPLENDISFTNFPINHDVITTLRIGYGSLTTKVYNVNVHPSKNTYIPLVFINGNSDNVPYGMFFIYEWPECKISLEAIIEEEREETLILGGLPKDFNTCLDPGDSFILPFASCGFYKGDIDSGSILLKEYQTICDTSDKIFPQSDSVFISSSTIVDDSELKMDFADEKKINDYLNLTLVELLNMQEKIYRFCNYPISAISGVTGSSEIENNTNDKGYKSALGFYNALDHFSQNINGFIYENILSNGSSYKDFATVKRSSLTSVMSGLSMNPTEVRRSFYYLSYAFPSSKLAVYFDAVNEQEYIQDNSYLSSFDETLSYRKYHLRSCLLGALYGFSEEDISDASDIIDLNTYKQYIKPLIKNGDLYHILEVPGSGGWDGIEYYDSEEKKGVCFIFNPGTIIKKDIIVLKGLDKDTLYKVWSQDDGNFSIYLTGSMLMDSGISYKLDYVFDSDILFFEEFKMDDSQPNEYLKSEEDSIEYIVISLILLAVTGLLVTYIIKKAQDNSNE